MMENNILDAFYNFNKHINEIVEKEGLIKIQQRTYDGLNATQFLSDILRRKKNLHPIPVSDFKILDEFLFIEKDIRYAIGVMYFLKPYINDTSTTGGILEQNMEDSRYLTHATYCLQSVYNFWDRIGDMLHLYFKTGLQNDRVYFGRVIENFEKSYKKYPEYIKIKQIYDSELKALFGQRDGAVHHFQLEAKYYYGNVENFTDRVQREAFNEEKMRLAERMKVQLELCYEGFELAIRLIDRLPNAFRVFIDCESDNGGKYFNFQSIERNSFDGPKDNLLEYFDNEEHYSGEDIAKKVAEKTCISLDLISVYLKVDDHNYDLIYEQK